MSAGFIITLLLLATAGSSFIAYRIASDRDARRVAGVICGVAALLSVAAVVMSSFTLVGTKKLGVVTSFGRPTDTLSNGLHLVQPWTVVTQLDAAIQTDTHAGDGKGDGAPCTDVRLSGQSTACIDNSVRWRMRLEAAGDLFRDYRDTDKVRDSLVTRELRAALNEVFSAYDPLAGINAASADKRPYTLDQLAVDVAAKLRARIGTQIEVLNVIIPLVRFDGATEDRIRSYQVAQADTRIAVQREETARAEARANAALSGSVSSNPYVLVSKCLDEMSAARKAGYGLPAGFSCWPGQGLPLSVAVGGR